MVSELKSIADIDNYICRQLNCFTEWEDRVGYICSVAKNYEAAMIYGRKVQRCNNNAYILNQGACEFRNGDFFTYSDSNLVSGLMILFSRFYSNQSKEQLKDYTPKFYELLVDIVPNDTIKNLHQAFTK
jgi:sulfur transfer protein SufE